MAVQHHSPAFLPVLFTFQRTCMVFPFIWASQTSQAVEGREVCYKDCYLCQVAGSMGWQEYRCQAQLQCPNPGKQLRRALTVREEAKACPLGWGLFAVLREAGTLILWFMIPQWHSWVPAAQAGCCEGLSWNHRKCHRPFCMQPLSVSAPFHAELVSQKEIFLDLPSWIHPAFFSAYCRDWKPNSVLLRLVRRKSYLF